MQNWKTSITGIVGGLAFIAAHFNFVVPDNWQAGIIGIAVIVLGLVSKDHSNTDGE